MSGPFLDTRIIPPAGRATRRPAGFVLVLYGDELCFFQRKDINLTPESGQSVLTKE